MTLLTTTNMAIRQAELEALLADANDLRWAVRAAANAACGELTEAQTAKIRATQAHLTQATAWLERAQAEMTDFSTVYGGVTIEPTFGGNK